MVAERIEGARFDQRIEHALGDSAAVDAVAEIKEGCEVASGCTSLDQLHGEMFPYMLDRGQAVENGTVNDCEPNLTPIDVGGRSLTPSSRHSPAYRESRSWSPMSPVINAVM
jgi:hypothetical protein